MDVVSARMMPYLVGVKRTENEQARGYGERRIGTTFDLHKYKDRLTRQGRRMRRWC